jgi:putative ABC transport system ATP-binding protein
VHFNETAVQTLDENRRAIWRGQHVGIVFQFFQLMPTLTVFENVLLPMELCKPQHTTPPETRARDLLAMVGLSEHGHKFPSKLSGGQQQRAALARALANDPPLLVADEPTGNLDSHTAAEVFDLFRRLVAEGKTIVLVTHDAELARQAQRVITLVDGHVSSAN